MRESPIVCVYLHFFFVGVINIPETGEDNDTKEKWLEKGKLSKTTSGHRLTTFVRQDIHPYRTFFFFFLLFDV